MARKFGTVNVAIWNDPEFRALAPAAQHLYLLLWTSPDLSFCGTHDWRPGRLTKLSSGFTEEHTRTVAACLTARHFFVIDEETEEILVRAWARFDELLKQPRLAVSYASAYSAVYSPTLRAVLANETRKMRDLWPDLACWKDERVAVILDHPAVSAKDLPTPADPFGPAVGDGFDPAFALGLAQTQGKVWPSVWAPPTPAPTPTPSTITPIGADKSAKAKRSTQLPDDWQPNDGHLAFAAENRIDARAEAAQFADHHRARGSSMKDWDAAFRTWLRNAVKFRKDNPGTRPAARLPEARDLEQPPDGLSPAEYAAWEREARMRRAAR
jgi:hypothetical protein